MEEVKSQDLNAALLTYYYSNLNIILFYKFFNWYNREYILWDFRFRYWVICEDYGSVTVLIVSLTLCFAFFLL